MCMVEQHYNKQIESHKLILQTLSKYAQILLWVKLSTFLLAVFFIYKYVFNGFPGVWIITAIVFLLGYFTALILDNKIQKKISLQSNLIQTLENELAYLAKDFSPFDDGKEFIDPEHPYSFDLDMFGDSSFFHRINRTVTDLGKKKLAEKLCNIPTDVSAIRTRQESLKELAKMSDWRTLFIAYGSGSKVKLARLLEQLNENKTKGASKSKAVVFGMVLSTALTLATIVLAILDIAPSSLPTLLFCLQILTAILVSSKVSRTAFQVSGLHKGLRSYGSIIHHILDVKFKSPELVGLQNSLQQNKEIDIRVAFRDLNEILSRLDQRDNMLAFIFLNGLFLYDLWTVRSFHMWQSKYAGYMTNWVNTIGEFDSLISLATYSFNNPDNCTVELLEGDASILEGAGVYHPFISRDKVIVNDFNLHSSHFAIVTGANMAGKSTFLRSMGVNYIMALNGLPVCAASFKVTPVKLFSSMRTSDNLVKNISYFNAELIRLEHLINYCKQNPHTLIILDEILKGTNSVDKLKGSKLLLEEISKLPVSGIIATHDLELTKMDEEFNHIDNYCFEIELGDEIIYTYKMGRGVAKNLNATYLLQKIIEKIAQ